MSMTAAASNDAAHALRIGARAGYAARGVVYLLIGILVLWSSMHGGASAPGSSDALAELGEQPFGTIALWLVCAGLVAFAVWRLVQAVRDPDGHGTDAKGIVLRTSLVVSALIHGTLAWSAATIAQGLGADSGEGWTAKLMAEPWGRWMVGLIGLVVIGAGIAHLVKGWKAGFMKYFDVGRSQLGALYNVCRFGLVARGIVFGIVGALLVQAAVRYSSDDTGGLRDAFNAILAQPYGVFLLALVGVGMLAFSVYCFVEAKHRRVEVR